MSLIRRRPSEPRRRSPCSIASGASETGPTEVGHRPDLAEHAAQEALSPLEVRVLRLIANGHTNKEIAAKLSVTERRGLVD